jgi:hypothetical protein
MINITRLREVFDTQNQQFMGKYLHQAILQDWQQLTPNWHPLGFIHTKLAEDDNATYRLHIWPVNLTAIRPQEHKIHDHLFDVESIVLAGAVENIEYEAVTSSQPPTHRILRVEYLPHGPKIYEDSTSCLLEHRGSKVISSTERYKIERHTLHETSRISNETAVTFIRTSRSSNYHPRVIVPLDAALPTARPQIKFPMNDWLALVDRHMPHE